MTSADPVVILVLMWLGAASVTRAITSDAVFAPWRVVHEKRVTERAFVVREMIRLMPPDHPLRWKQARRFEALVAWADFPGCRWCVGWWVFGVAALVAWIAMGCPGHVWGGPSWFTVLAVWQAGRWLYGIVARWVDPQSQPAVSVVSS